MITIAIGADHRGFLYKQFLMQQLNVANVSIRWFDVGAFDQQRSDYPHFAYAVCEKIIQKQAALGILLCGSGIGMSIAANRYRGIYAALAWNEEVAQLSRSHDCANVLVLPADFISESQALSMVRIWLETSPMLDEHYERLLQIDRLSMQEE